MLTMEAYSQERSEEIKNYARANIKSYLTAIEEGGTHWWRSIESLSGQVAQEYQGRVLYELIQNASDAHGRAGYSAPVRIRLNRSEGHFGTLYVTNGGSPFTRADFEAINSIAQSSKPPGEGIGNKGLGFRSVMTISDWPEVYSSESEGRPTGELNGYCFGFARPEELINLCLGDQELVKKVEQDLPAMLLPSPRYPLPRQVADLADDKTVTVIRLPLRSKEAIRSVEQQIKQLSSDEAPLLLFLNLISELSVEIIDEDKEDRTLTEITSRDVTRLDLGSNSAIIFEIIDLEKKGKFFVASLSLKAEELRSEIEKSVQKNYMNERWLDWSEPSSVSVACRIDGGECLPNIYTFLPMAEAAPFAGYLNAPFFTDLGRVGLRLDVPFNEFIFNVGAKLCAASSIALANSYFEFAPSCSVDLIAWDDNHAKRIERAFEQLGSTLMNASIIPTSHPEFGIVWSPIKSSWRWIFAGDYVTSERLTAITGVRLVLVNLGEERIDRLHEFIRNWRDEGLDPAGDKRATWFERIASHLSETHANIDVWDQYYEDLVGAFRSDAESLRGRLILVDSEGKCAPAATASYTNPKVSRIAVFFPPAVRGEGEDDEDETDEAFGLTVPSVLKDRIRFMHGDLTWQKHDGRTVTKLSRRRFIEDNNLVRVFRRSNLLVILADTLESSSSPRVHQECLRWAYELFRSSRSSRSLDLKDIPFQIPCSGGLKLATETFFSVGWNTKDAQELEAFLTDAGDVSPELAKLRENLIVRPKDWPFDIGNIATFREFLETAGVRDGLWPDVIRKNPINSELAGFEIRADRVDVKKS
jgi:hypothetical protein